MNRSAILNDPALLFEQSPEALILADRHGVIRAWNAAAERMFGHAANAAVGQSLDLVIPEPFRARHWAGYERALAARATQFVDRWLPTRALRAGAEEFYVELGFAIVLGADREVEGVLASARDITERFQRDRELRRRLRELEASAKI